MAVNHIGNLTYINQSAPVASSLYASSQSHPLAVNTSLFAEQAQKIEETRPLEHTNEIKNDDKKGNSQGSFKEALEDSLSKEQKEENSQDKEISEDLMLMKPESHLLDIKG